MDKSKPPRPLWNMVSEEVKFLCLGCEQEFPLSDISRDVWSNVPLCFDCSKTKQLQSNHNHIQLGKDKGEEETVAIAINDDEDADSASDDPDP